MPTELTLWELQEDGSVVQVNEASLSAESQIEDAIESAPELLGTRGPDRWPTGIGAQQRDRSRTT